MTWYDMVLHEQCSLNMNILEIWSTYQKYGQHTRNMVNIPQKKEKVTYLAKKYKKAQSLKKEKEKKQQ